MSQSIETLIFFGTLTVDTAAYAANDLVWDTALIATIAQLGYRSGRIVEVLINDKDNEKVPLDIHFLGQNRDAGSINSAPTLTDAHSDDELGLFEYSSTSYRTTGTSAATQQAKAHVPCQVGFDANIAGLYWYALYPGSGTPQYTAGTDLTYKVKVEVYL